MNRSMVAGAALIAGLAIASPMLAWSASESEPQMAQVAGPGAPGMGPGMGRWGRDADGDGHGPMGQHRGWFGGMMHRMMAMSPQQRCEEHLARRAGAIAYTIAKLNLTAEQRPLWDKVQAPLQTAAEKERQLCAAMKPRDQRGQETVLDRLNRREQFLTARLQTIQQTKPAMEQFYQALSPDQKAIIDHPFRRG
jgi:hypothetical protein